MKLLSTPYYDSLTLFSPARYSHLPGLPFPGDPDRYPSRDDVITYLETYAQHFAFPISFNSRVTKIEREGRNFFVVTDKQKRILARTIVVASGPFNQANIPAFNGLSEYKGQILHSSEYHRPADIRGARVAVIGAGNSAVQIAYELSRTHDVVLTSREPPRFLQQRPFGKDLHFWLKYSGVDTLPLGQWFNWKSTAPVLDAGIYRNAFRKGKIQYRPIFENITVDGLRWKDAQKQIETLVFATGFINQPAYLESLDVAAATKVSKQCGGVAKDHPGVYFVGVAWQRSNASATLRGVGNDAQYVIQHIQRYLGESKRHAILLPGCCS